MAVNGFNGDKSGRRNPIRGLLKWSRKMDVGNLRWQRKYRNGKT